MDKLIPKKSSAGIINGLWANSMGQGGIIPIEAKFFPSTSFMDLKLTGLQGDVMKESMTVAKTLASSLVDKSIIKETFKRWKKQKCKVFIFIVLKDLCRKMVLVLVLLLHPYYIVY
jgi:ATP-dependent Lon protease